ncbi:MAG: LptF/LptG family permease [Pirellulaceae bacterium]|nr:LptF/LptG family permease [Pirellulaceae bacterium]
MTIIDRYLLTLFVRTLVICSISLFGLYVVADAFNNLDEFISYGKSRSGGVAMVLVDYYSPRALWFFDKVAGLLAMASVIFSITILKKSLELTALMAAGISPARVVTPLVVFAAMIAGLGVANREFGLPSVRDKLTRNAQDWQGSRSRKCTPRYDLRTDVLLSGTGTIAEGKRITEPQFRLPPEMAAWGRQIAAVEARHLAANDEHPAGYLLKQVSQPSGLHLIASHTLDGDKVLFSPSDTPWLASGEVFVASMVPFEQLSVGGSYRQYLSSYEIITGLANRTLEPGADLWVTLHSRPLAPLLDVSLVLLCLPLVLGRGSRNIFLAAGLCALVAAAMQFVVLTCHGLGSNYLLDPLIAAWTPLVLFGPLAYALARPQWD